MRYAVFIDVVVSCILLAAAEGSRFDMHTHLKEASKDCSAGVPHKEAGCDCC